jgi:PAS domain S-box-containing protein
MAIRNEIELRSAIRKDKIEPYFQPIVEVRTGILTGFEALARWKHPLRGMVPPDEFIPLAEKTGLIGLLHQNLLRKVFIAAAAMPDHVTLSVNISATQFHDRSLSQQIRSAADQGEFPLHRLILEIKESSLIGDLDLAKVITHDLKALGVKLLLDDFGTGYSSLRYLQALPFDKLKIDASFVRSMSQTRDSRKIAAAIINLGYSLGLGVVAEGVETREQADMLLRLGCDFGQGWLYGLPAPERDLAGIIAAETLLPDSEPTPKSDVTDQLSSMEALPPVQRLAQLQAIYDGAPVGLAFLDRNLRYISINKCLAEMKGIPVALHLGRSVAEVIPKLYIQAEPYMRRALAGEATSAFEVIGPTADTNGKYPTLQIYYQPVRDEAGEIVGLSLAVVDISERKLMEEALRESEDHYRHAVDLNPQIPWTTDAKGMVLEISPRWKLATGLTEEQTRGDGWLKALHPEDVPKVIGAWNHCLLTGDPLDIEYRISSGDGIWRWMRSRGSPRRSSTGEIIRWYGSVENIDDRKRAVIALQEAEEQLDNLIENSPVAIVTADGEGRILLSNEAAHSLFGAKDRVLRDVPISRYLPSLSSVPILRNGKQPFRTVMQCKGYREDKSIFLADVWFSTYRTTVGSRLSAMIIDSSEELRDREESGWQHVLTGSRILVGAFAHETRNICSAIAIVHQNLSKKEGLPSDPDFEALGTLVRALKNIASIELRQAGNLSTGMDLKAFLEELRIIIEPSLFDAKINTDWVIPQEKIQVWADRQGLMQVFLNLIRNSKSALSEQLRPSLSIRARIEPQSVFISIIDNGVGVSNPELLFKPFQENSHSTGLGLYLSRALMHSFRGELHYEPSSDGAIFTVELSRLPEVTSREC